MAVRATVQFVTLTCPTTGETFTVEWDEFLDQLWHDVQSCECCGTSVRGETTVRCEACGGLHDVAVGGR